MKALRKMLEDWVMRAVPKEKRTSAKDFFSNQVWTILEFHSLYCALCHISGDVKSASGVHSRAWISAVESANSRSWGPRKLHLFDPQDRAVLKWLSPYLRTVYSPKIWNGKELLKVTVMTQRKKKKMDCRFYNRCRTKNFRLCNFFQKGTAIKCLPGFFNWAQ